MKMKFVALLIAAPMSLLVACNNETAKEESSKKETSTADDKSRQEKNKQAALANVNAFLSGNTDAMLKDAVPDMIDYNDGSMPPVKGADSIRAGIKQWRECFSDYKCENILAIADGDYVVVTGEWNATFKKDFGAMKVAGKSFRVKDADIYRFNAEGKMTEHRSIQSSLEMMKQLGVVTVK